MSFVRKLTFGIHVSADAHWYSRLVITFQTYFWRLTLIYNVSAEANCFLQFIKITFLIALATPTLRISFCWSWARALFSELKVGEHLHICTCHEFKVAAHVWIWFTVVHCVSDSHILCYNELYLLLLLSIRLLLESSYFLHK